MVLKLKKNMLVNILFGLFILIFFVFVFLVTRRFNDGDEWVKRIGDKKISSSEYLLMLTTGIVEAEGSLKKHDKFGSITLEDFKTSNFEGKPTLEYVENKAKETLDTFLVNRVRFEKLGCKFDEKEQEEIKRSSEDGYKYFNNGWQGYKIGISQKTLNNYVEDIKRVEKIREALYDEGKPYAATDDVLLGLAKDNMLKYKKITISKIDKADDSKKDDEDKKEEKKEENNVNISEVVSNITNKLKEGKDIKEIEKEYEDGKTGVRVSASDVFDFMQDSAVNKEKSYKDPKKKAEEDFVKDLNIDEIKDKDVNDNGASIYKRVDIKSEDLAQHKGALNGFYIEEKEKEFVEQAKKENPIVDNKRAFKKYTASVQADKVFANQLEEPIMR